MVSDQRSRATVVYILPYYERVLSQLANGIKYHRELLILAGPPVDRAGMQLNCPKPAGRGRQQQVANSRSSFCSRPPGAKIRNFGARTFDGPLPCTLLLFVAPNPNGGYGRVARVGLSASIGVKPTSVADSHAVARGVLTGVRDAASEFKMPNSPPHA